VETGLNEFQRYCAACHGTDATGGGPVTPLLRTAPPDLTGLARRHDGVFPAADVAAMIDGRFEIAAHGTRTMPVWGRVLGERIAEATTADEVSRGRIDALVSYLQSIQH
jgi:mono/diheme cytochrome c family protein